MNRFTASEGKGVLVHRFAGPYPRVVKRNMHGGARRSFGNPNPLHFHAQHEVDVVIRPDPSRSGLRLFGNDSIDDKQACVIFKVPRAAEHLTAQSLQALCDGATPAFVFQMRALFVAETVKQDPLYAVLK